MINDNPKYIIQSCLIPFCSLLYRTSVIVSRGPLNPEIDPRVQEILMEVVIEGQTTSEHTNNYEVSEQFSYFDGDLNVINDNGDDNDTY